MTTSRSTADGFVGWLRHVPRGRWQPVVRAAGHDACLDALLRAADDAELNDHLELIVLPDGRTPTEEGSSRKNKWKGRA